MMCRVHFEGRQHNGIVLDISGNGLFIQTSAKLAPGEKVDIDLSLPDDTARMHVEVVRRKQVPARLLSVAQGGIGVRILSAPESFYRFLHNLQVHEGEERGEVVEEQSAAAPRPAAAPAATPRPATPVHAAPAAPPPEPQGPPKPRFRVRVCQTQGARSRVFDTEASSAEEASRQVLRDLGEDWKLLKVDPL